MYKYNAKEWKERILEACNNSNSMSAAASKLPMNYKTFKRLAVEIGVFDPNQSGKGMTKPKSTAILTEDILSGKYPQFQTYKLKQRLIRDGYKESVCENCNSAQWMGQDIPLELHHVDGDSHNHVLDNLKLLCPNCHALTDTYRSKNRKV